MFFKDFVCGGGPFVGMNPSELGVYGQSFGAGNFAAPGYGNNYRIFGRMPDGMPPAMVQAYRSWRAWAIFRLVLLLFVGLPAACLLLFYGFGVLGDVLRAAEPHLPQMLRPQMHVAADLFVAMRNVVSPYVNQAMAMLNGIWDWIRSFASGGSGA